MNIKKHLPIIDICANLPYGLKAYCSVSKQCIDVDFRCDLSGIILRSFNDDSKPEKAIVSPYQLLKDDKLKPILFPISCLTKEIIVDGENFIPLVKLAEIVFPIYEWYIDGNCAESNTGCWFWFCEGSFSVDGTISNSVPHQDILFDKLREWKIDYRGLIDKKLAVSALDLDNPYK